MSRRADRLKLHGGWVEAGSRERLVAPLDVRAVIEVRPGRNIDRHGVLGGLVVDNPCGAVALADTHAVNAKRPAGSRRDAL